MAELALSTYQKKIIDAFKTTKDNIFINALAGTGKTFILVELSKHINSYSLFIAFNKAIQEELNKRITNPKFKTYTFNGLGYAIMRSNWEKKEKEKSSEDQSYVQKTLTIDNRKIAAIIANFLIHDPLYSFIEKEEQYDMCNVLAWIYDLCRQKMVNFDDRKAIDDIINFYGIEISNIEHLNEIDLCKMMKDIFKEDFRQFEEEGIIDFVDQVYITYLKVIQREWILDMWFTFENIAVDEAQDLSKLQQLFVGILRRRKTSRLIFCGDKNQAIYSFAGADCSSIDNIERMYHTKSYDLPINYRCPVSHLNYVNNRFEIPIQPAPNAIKGEMGCIDYDEICNEIKPGDCILSRKNADLCKIALIILQHNMPVYIKDAKLLDNLISIIKRAKNKIKDLSLLNDYIYNIKQERKKVIAQQKEDFINQIKAIGADSVGSDVLNNLSPSAADEIQDDVLVAIGCKESNEILTELSDGVVDMLECVEILFRAYSTECLLHNNKVKNWADFIDYVQDRLNTKDKTKAIQCVSIHLAKGQEYERVFILNNNKIYYELANTADQATQEKNLAYIAATRSKKTIYFVNKDESDHNTSNEYNF